MNDLKFAYRQLLKNPGFTIVAVLTLALGIGANTAIFSVVNGVILRPLPYPEPDRLVQVLGGQSNADSPWLAVPDLQEIQEVEGLFEKTAVYGFRNLIDLNGDEPVALFGTAVLPGSFEALGTTPILGRNFLPGERIAGAGNVIILSYEYWRQRFNSEPEVIGRIIQFKDQSYEVIGVMPADFSFPDTSLVRNESRFWVPLTFPDYALKNRTSFSHQLVGRLKSGVTFENAQARLNLVAARLGQEFPQNRERVFRLVPLHSYLVGKVQFVLWVLFGAVVLVLLIACANVANLLFARSVARQHELAIRASLGAGRFRLVQQSLTESLLLSVLGAISGIMVAHIGLNALRLILPPNVPRVTEIEIDAVVLSFTLGLCLLTTFLAGVGPAIRLSKLNLVAPIKSARASSSQSRLTVHKWVMGFQTAVALIILIGAGLLVKSFWRLQQIDLGFNPKNVLTVAVNTPAGRSTPEQVPQFYTELASRAGIDPMVTHVGFVDAMPLSGMNTYYTFQIEGRERSQDYGADRRVVSGDYFQAMGIPLVRGRLFTREEQEASSAIAIINQTMARKFWGNEDPLGKRISMEGQTLIEIVGVVGDLRHSGPEAEARPEIYEPLSRHPKHQYLQLVARTRMNSPGLAENLRRSILSMNPAWPVDKMTSVEQMLRSLTAARRFNMSLFASFGIVALILCTIGIYGVISYGVAERTREFGIRMALGARRGDVLRMVLMGGMKLAGTAIAIGLVGAFAFTRFLRSLLFGISSLDVATFGSVSLLLLIVALCACLMPARRATQVNPVEALRYE
jgi:putative ABC transport system permease protein